ncbi:MAG: hypothetical protein A3G85_05350 [Elusimicrobia bacterium RIFCSPLOWO2_12_FULL_39_28]|nr:MAG: hypothetical protein A2034_01340 [Elusimicrobia bacterium GWA2_38_7]OGR98756.1 MAG: hypothetical protein A3G85_05350 [Elusimicrobia bacterium RIFCSPLOWO2_12_FULL_39_28]
MNHSMISFPLTLQYAFKGLVFIAKNPAGKTINVQEIAEIENLPSHFLGKIFQRLVLSNILDSKRGPGGGYILLKRPEQVHLLEVANSLMSYDGEKRECLFGLGACGEVEHCPIHGVVKTTEKEIEKLLEDWTLLDLVNGKQ